MSSSSAEQGSSARPARGWRSRAASGRRAPQPLAARGRSPGRSTLAADIVRPRGRVEGRSLGDSRLGQRGRLHILHPGGRWRRAWSSSGERRRQFLFISSASAYQKPLTDYLITESTPLANPLWDYSRNKIACEERLLRAYREEGYPRDDRPAVPDLRRRDACRWRSTAGSRATRPWTACGGACPLIVPGDGLSLWTHHPQFRLRKGPGRASLGTRAPSATPSTSRRTRRLSWNQIYADDGGGGRRRRSPKLVHIASDFIAACIPSALGSLLGDKSHTAIFDNAKIKRFVPGLRRHHFATATA
jgi:hypothetical protein